MGTPGDSKDGAAARARGRTRVTSVFMLLFVACAYGWGFLTADQGFFPDPYFQSAKMGLKSVLERAKPEATPRARHLSTALLRLRLDEIPVAVPRAGTGGGVTSVGDEVLVLAGDGTVFSLSGTSVRRTNIRVPDNGFDAYRAAAETTYRELAHTFDRFRYNDILYYSDAAGTGLVVSYTEWLAARECYGTAVAFLPLSQHRTDDSVEDIEAKGDHWEVIYRTQPCLPLKQTLNAIDGHIAGGALAYVHPNKVLLGSGDYQWDGVYAPLAYAQGETNDYGKILEIDLHGKTARHVSIGNRNVQGLLIDRSGQTWAVEQGPRGGDELNHIEDGANYGWPEATLGTRYNHLPWPSARQYGRHDDFTAPAFAWVPSVAVSSITQIDNFDPSWDGDFMLSSLKAQSLFRLRIREGRVEFSEPIPVGRRIREVHQHTDGRIIVWTDSNTLILVSRAERSFTDAFIARQVRSLDLDPVREKRLTDALAACAECHSFEADDNTAAPSLSNLFEQPIGSRPYASYSKGLSARRGYWTETMLAQYLANPNAGVPGTTMPDPQLSTEVIADIVKVLKGLTAAESETLEAAF